MKYRKMKYNEWDVRVPIVKSGGNWKIVASKEDFGGKDKYKIGYGKTKNEAINKIKKFIDDSD